MVFHGNQPPGSKSSTRSSIGRRSKKGHTYAAHQIYVEAELANDVLASEDNTSTGNPDDPTLPPPKKQRPDDNWRVQRAVLERDKKLIRCQAKLENMTSKKEAALKLNTSLNEKVSDQKKKIKQLEHERFKEAKARRIEDIQKEAAHRLEIASLTEEYSQKIEEAVEYANSETAKKLETEKARIMSDSQCTARLRKERQRSSDKLKKERAGQAAVVDHSHQRWIKNLAINLASQQRSNDIKNSKLQKQMNSMERSNDIKTSKLQKKMDSMDVKISNERKFNGDR